MLDLLIAQPWLLALLWAGMYVFDYASTLWLARAYETTLTRYMVYEAGVELNPNLEQAIARRRPPGLRVYLALALVFLIILLSSYLGTLMSSPWLANLFLEFLAGALLLTWCFINSRHLRNYVYVWSLRRRPTALGGKQEYSYWFMQRTLAAEALAFSLLFFFFFLLTWRIFFVAGTLTCTLLALRAWRLANRKFPPPNEAVPSANPQ